MVKISPYSAFTFVFVFAGLLCAPTFAFSGTVSPSSTVSMRYLTTCSVGTLTTIDFGTLTAGSTPSSDYYRAGGVVTVSCTAGTAFGVWIGSSSNTLSGQRRMVNGASGYLNYNLYLDNYATLAPTTRTATGYTSTSGAVNVPINAQIPTGQTLNFGSYSDTITFNVSW